MIKNLNHKGTKTLRKSKRFCSGRALVGFAESRCRSLMPKAMNRSNHGFTLCLCGKVNCACAREGALGCLVVSNEVASV